MPVAANRQGLSWRVSISRSGQKSESEVAMRVANGDFWIRR